jgi:hypothetical protein
MNDRRQFKDSRRKRLLWRLFALLLPCYSGCTAMLSLPVPADPQAFLKSIETAPNSVTLEIFQVRFPTSDRQMDQELWQVVDEQRLDVDLRHELIRNGFRAGVLGGTVPSSLAKYLKLESEMPENTTQRLITGESADPSVTRRVVQLNNRESATIQVSALRDELNVMLSDSSGLRGRSYQQVEAVYTLRAQAKPGQQVALKLTPELQHGELRNRYAGSDQGIFLVTPSRERELYDQLELSVQMTAGELLVVSTLPEAAGSLGHAFHAESKRGPAELKLVLVRLVEVPGSEILAETDF